MATITLPEKVIKGEEFVAIPKKEYAEYLQLRKAIPVVKMTQAEKRKWGQAKKDYEAGKFITLAELKRELEFTRQRKSQKGHSPFASRRTR